MKRFGRNDVCHLGGREHKWSRRPGEAGTQTLIPPRKVSDLFAFVTAFLVAFTALHAESEEVRVRFVDRAKAAGLNEIMVYGGVGSNRYLLETTGSGAAFLDYDNDGWLDVFLVNGSRLGKDSLPGAVSRLFRNKKDGTFEDVTAQAGVGRSGWGQSVCAGDYDNSGHEDLFVTYWGQNVLYRNRGDSTFETTTKAAGLTQDRRRWNSGCAFLDYDRDGDLDLFVGNYIDFELETTAPSESGLCLYRGISVACGPSGLLGGKNILYRNEGNGTFSDQSRPSGIVDAFGTYALGALTLDYDNDGWVDIYVANDSDPSTLYRNNKDGTFTDVGVLSGAAYSMDGRPQAGMGVSSADVNQDGYVDIFKTNFSEDTSNLYLNLGKGIFEESAFRTGLASNTRFLGWGCGLFDLDNDGWIDVFQVNGHVYPEIEQLEGLTYRQRKIVYVNREGKRFEDVTETIGGDVMIPRAGRGAAFGDFDNDGDIDVLVNNVNDTPSLYRNDTSPERHWIAIRPLGTRSNRSGIGARVRVRAGDLDLIGEVRSGGSYYSQNQLRVQFGLGETSTIDLIEVVWPSGQLDRFENVPSDRLVYLYEGEEELRRGRRVH